jgi:hypothetical protein
MTAAVVVQEWSAMHMCHFTAKTYMTIFLMTAAAVVQERRAGIDCDALEADLACMQRATRLAAGIGAAREALAGCVELCSVAQRLLAHVS